MRLATLAIGAEDEIDRTTALVAALGKLRQPQRRRLPVWADVWMSREHTDLGLPPSTPETSASPE